MKIQNKLVILFILFYTISCNNMKNKGQNFDEVRIHLEDTVEDIDPPPPNLKSDFVNVHGWLDNICNGEKPQKPVSRIELGLFESKTDLGVINVLYFVGVAVRNNTYSLGYRPAQMHFLLPQKYSELNSAELQKTLISEIIDFTKTRNFESSFLAESKEIFFMGSRIWTK